jgi:phenylpyruvate tautomerase PptA (4-oxalocrotonate tautomerase family)
MPMIDVYATEGMFSDKHTLAEDLAKAVMRWEQVPEIPLFLNNTAAFIHDLPADAISNAAGDSNYVRVQVLTPINVLDRDKQLGVVKELTEIVVAAAGDPTLADRTWVLITESPEGGWGIDGHANTGADIVAAARAALQAEEGPRALHHKPAQVHHHDNHDVAIVQPTPRAPGQLTPNETSWRSRRVAHSAIAGPIPHLPSGNRGFQEFRPYPGSRRAM